MIRLGVVQRGYIFDMVHASVHRLHCSCEVVILKSCDGCDRAGMYYLEAIAAYGLTFKTGFCFGKSRKDGEGV